MISTVQPNIYLHKIIQHANMTIGIITPNAIELGLTDILSANAKSPNAIELGSVDILSANAKAYRYIYTAELFILGFIFRGE